MKTDASGTLSACATTWHILVCSPCPISTPPCRREADAELRRDDREAALAPAVLLVPRANGCKPAGGKKGIGEGWVFCPCADRYKAAEGRNAEGRNAEGRNADAFSKCRWMQSCRGKKGGRKGEERGKKGGREGTAACSMPMDANLLREGRRAQGVAACSMPMDANLLREGRWV
eukprot:211657-Chlamydomonas_euryale.AAC.1